MNDYFVWEGSRIMLSLGEFELPFPLSIYGLVAALIFGYFGFRYLTEKRLEQLKKSGNKKKAKAEDITLPPLQQVGVIFGALILGQLLFAILPSPSFTTVGPIEIRWYGVLFALSFLTGYAIEYRLFKDAGRPLEELDRLLTYILIATIVGARLGHVIFYDVGFYLRNPFEIIAIWHGGLASHGAAIAIIIAMYLFAKKHKGMTFLWLADRLVISVALAGAFIRTGNFFNSEILGRATDLPWAVVFARVDQIPRHPTMLYEALLCLVVLAVIVAIYRWYKTNPPQGAIFGAFLSILFLGRFLLEYTKTRQAAFAEEWALSMGQWLSIPLVIYGIWLLWKVDWKTPDKSHAEYPKKS